MTTLTSLVQNLITLIILFLVVERHRGQLIFLKYEGEGPITKTIMPVGKGTYIAIFKINILYHNIISLYITDSFTGITYDTGGADIKAGGVMAGMSRDKW